MKLVLRLILAFIRSTMTGQTNVGTEVVARFRVMPTDLDFNGHMTNNRYHTIMDYAAIGLLASHGILAVMFRNRWRPIVGCSLISHRKSLKMLDQYVVRSKVIYCDEVWSYLSHIMEHDGRVIAAANRKYALLGGSGIVSPQEVFAEIGVDFINRPAGLDSVRSWVDAEKTILEHSQNDDIGPENQIGFYTTMMECKNESAETVRCEPPDTEVQPCLYAGLECAERPGCHANEEKAHRH